MARSVRKNKSFVPEILIFFGIFLVSLSTLHNFLRLRSLSIDKQTIKNYESVSSVTSLIERPQLKHIFIKWYVDVDIEPNVYQNDRWTVSEDTASHLVSSGRPGETGNIIIYGHNKRSILGNIRALKGNEMITLTLGDGSSREYQVASLQQVSPSDTQLLLPTDDETLTIYTCSGLLDSQRFVVRAKPVN